MKTGDVVKVSGSFSKNDNGLFWITHSPGDPGWSGSNYALQRICKNGRISTAKYSHSSWPLHCYMNDQWKRACFYEHNKTHASIEVVTGVNRDSIADVFLAEIEQNKKAADYERYSFPDSEYAAKLDARNDFLYGVITRIAAE